MIQAHALEAREIGAREACLFTHGEIAKALGIEVHELCALCRRAGVRLPLWGRQRRVYIGREQVELLRQALARRCE